MKTTFQKLCLLIVLAFVPLSSALAQQLPPIPSNFDTTVWARKTENPPELNTPKTFGELPVPCSFSHLRHDDPIVSPGVFNKSPLNVFFGNTLTNANSNFSSLRQKGDGTCFGGPLNRSAYYIPSMMNAAGKVVLPDFIDVNYRGTAMTRPFPRGLKMIFGRDPNDKTYQWNADSARWSWSYTNGQGMWWGTPKDNSGTYHFQDFTPNTYPSWIWNGGYHQMAIRVVSPHCWDGKNLDSANHRSHLAYQVADASKNLSCPGTHPIEIPEVVVTVSYRNTGLSDVNGWYLSSDRFNGKNDAPGTNFYVGMIPAWDDGIMAAWTTNILNALKFGADGKIDQTRILEKPPTSKNFGPTSKTNRPYFLYTLHSFNFPWGFTEADNAVTDPPVGY